MTLEELNAKVRTWDQQHPDPNDATAKSKYGIILDQLYYHAKNEWHLYLPTAYADVNTGYLERLAAWIGNATTDADQKLLLEYALFISFFSHDDFVSLYRTAMDREVSRWVAERVGARLEPHGCKAFHNLVSKEIHAHTWFCRVTDSMDINEFHKVNNLQGVSLHPDFFEQQKLAEDPTNPNAQLAGDWIRYMANPSPDPQNPLRCRPPLERIVLLEDIVGSASQCIKAIRWVVSNLGKPVLFVPLILCPNGVDALRAEEGRSNGQLTVRPVIQLRRNDLVGPERQGHQGWPIATDIEDFATRHAARASANMDTFGYLNTGCSIATFSNTPDNTLPIVHNKPNNENWEPLFYRVPRGD